LDFIVLINRKSMFFHQLQESSFWLSQWI